MLILEIEWLQIHRISRARRKTRHGPKMEPLNSQLVTQAMNFHGQQLQKMWESERGEQDLSKNNIRDLNYEFYNKRSKHLSFQDRGKRLKLQQFIVKKANLIFSNELLDKPKAPEDAIVTEDMYAIMPPLETYLSVDKQTRLKYFFEVVVSVICF